MDRVGHVWRVRRGLAAEYDRRHAEIWPELSRLFRSAGVREYHIYRWGDIVFSHIEVEDYDRLVAICGEDPVAARWESAMGDLVDYPKADASGWPERLVYVWSLDDDEAAEENR